MGSNHKYFYPSICPVELYNPNGLIIVLASVCLLYFHTRINTFETQMNIQQTVQLLLN